MQAVTPTSESAKSTSRRVLLCVGGGIAAYKSVELVRRLRDAGCEVRVAMTHNAQRFVGAVSFAAVSGHPVRASLWDEDAEAAMGHVELARWAQQVLIAPATANVLAKLAHGLADDLVSTLCLATTAPITVAPAMNLRMWEHPATQRNIETLRAHGVQVIGPDDGAQACGEFGPGRMREPVDIVEALLAAMPHAGPADADASIQDLEGRRIIITAGPTFEDLDPVRYLGNRSSGRMGFALAAAAARRGAQVQLIAGPVHLSTPPDVHRIDVRSAAQMHAAAQAALPADVFIGAAAVADFAPRTLASDKLKKRDLGTGETLTVELVRTPDVLADVASCAQRPTLVVGFAAETRADALETYAREKLHSKGLDLVAANHVGTSDSGFDSDSNTLTVYARDSEHALGRAPKTRLAERLLDLIAQRLATPDA